MNAEAGFPHAPGRRRFVAIVAILPAALALTACVPYYYKETRVPQIHGTLMRDGTPVRGADVFLMQKVVKTRPCESLVDAGHTDEQGAFTIPMELKARFFRTLLNPPDLVLRITAICFRVPGEAPIYGGHFVTRSHIPVTLQIECDEARPEHDPLIHGSSICRDLNRRSLTGSK